MSTPCWQTVGVRGDHSCPELPQYGHCQYCPRFAEGARASLRRPVDGAYLAAAAAEAATALAPTEHASASLLVFRVGPEWLGLDPLRVRAVLPTATPQRLPHRRTRGLLGVVHGDGLLHPAVSLAELLGSGSGSARPGRHAFARLLLVDADGLDLALPVDEVDGLLRYAPARVQPVPATVGHGLAPLLDGLVADGARHIGRFDSAALMRQLRELLR
ncbi:chemotaxis protein CheW [Massilia sp. TS11]|uniref:chemotaxis protein CheW n=1 Tax=Massilia sp. TS11 TaxID=2908003 RepID=UPI001EDBE476|nr:chemotaxis protein CheW [Massilia sp. TS11]MCG2586187.1 chemotaxis protein CheW [Massilia sp. TS11]